MFVPVNATNFVPSCAPHMLHVSTDCQSVSFAAMFRIIPSESGVQVSRRRSELYKSVCLSLSETILLVTLKRVEMPCNLDATYCSNLARAEYTTLTGTRCTSLLNRQANVRKDKQWQKCHRLSQARRCGDKTHANTRHSSIQNSN